jgi:hypothetical protein
VSDQVKDRTNPVRDRWMGEAGGVKPHGEGNRLWHAKTQEVPGQLLALPVNLPNRMTLEELCGSMAWQKLDPRHKQMMASYLYGDKPLSQVVEAFGHDAPEAAKIAEAILNREDVRAVIALLNGKA